MRDPGAQNGNEIAIVGMAGRFPGAGNVAELWRNVLAGAEAVTRLTDEQLRAAGVDPALLADPSYVKAAALLDGIDLFDAGFFGFSPREAESMDPQHRLFLECAWEALEDAACDPETFRGLIGVFAGSGFCRYLMQNLLTNPDAMRGLGDLQIAVGNERDALPTMISYKLNLRGPSFAVQTFCSTSLVAIHLAAQSLLNFECDAALAGGVAIDLPQEKGYLWVPGGVLSPDGHCRTFDARAEGSIMGNGVALVVLKRLEDALADGDTVHAVIKGSAINNDGIRRVGYTAPGVDGQAAAVVEALASGGVDPATVSYVETHGTATPLGDSVEIAALKKAFQSVSGRRVCALGSIKTNVGHLDRAAGVTGLIKAALALESRLLPPSLHFEQPNPDFALDESPFYVNTDLTEWRRDGTPLRAGVSSFGVGGTNAHVVLEEPPPREPTSPSRPWQLVVLSAKTAGALDGAAVRLAEHLRRHPDLPLADVAYTLQVGRGAFNHRRSVVCADLESAAAALETQDPKRVFSSCEERRDRPVVFLLPGLGDQYPGMARGLYEEEPVFREVVDRCCALLAPELGLDLREVLLPPRSPDGEPSGTGIDLRRMLRRDSGEPDPAAARLNQTRFAQPAVFIVEVALARLLESWGIVPQALIGYSLGEYTAACLSGVLPLEDALTLVARRAALIQDLPAGAMLGISLSEEEVRPWLTGDLCLAGVNGPALTVAAGPVDQVEDLERRLTASGVTSRPVATTHAFHSEMMRPIADRLRELLSRMRLRPPRIPCLSNVTGTWMTPEQATDPGYWVRHLCEPVRFGDGLRELLSDPDRILLEVGPGQTLGTFARQLRGEGGMTVVSSLRFAYDRQPDQAYLLTTLGRLWLAGARIDWTALYRGEVRRRLPLPTYAFERKRYWIEPGSGGPVMARPASGKKPDVADWFYLPAWQPSPRPPREAEPGEGGWLAFVDDCSLGLRLTERLRAMDRVVTVRPGRGFARLGADAYEIDPRAAGDYQRVLADLRAGEAGMPRRIVHLWSAAPPAASGPETTEEERFQAAQDAGFFSLLFLAQGLAALNVIEPLRLFVVSNGVHEVTRAEEILPERATLAGPCRVIPQELLNVTCRSLDVVLPTPGSWREERLVERLAGELVLERSDLTVAWRGDDRWVLDYVPVRLEGAPVHRAPLREGGVYLLTGGLGGVGLILAEHLARRYRARLVLLGRSGLPPRERWPQLVAAAPLGDATARRMRKAMELEELGAELLVVAADVADPRSLRAALDRARERFGPLHGVIHAAGISDDSGFRTLQETSPAECEWQFRPKIQGVRVLEEALRGEELDFVLVFSSIAAVLGGLGFVAYTAANAYMDAFVQRLDRDSRTPWIAVNWDSWPSRDDQYAVVGGTVAEFTMTRDEGGEAFERVLTGAAGPLIVHSTGDLQARIDQWVKLEAARDGGGSGTRHERPELATRYVEPETAQQRVLVAIWQELLGIEPVGIHDDFFELGGHSLLATQMFSRVRAALGVDLPLRSVFEAPTVAGLCELISVEGPEESVAAPAPLVIPRVDRAAELPLSFAQQRLWFLDRLQPGNPFYNICLSARILGELSTEVLRLGLAEIVRRHEVLRTTFVEIDGRPVQRIAPPAVPPLPVSDLRDLPEEEREDEAFHLGLRHHRQPFDLATGPLLRFQLARLRDREHLFFFTIHHSVADDWSIGVFLGELVAIYEAFRAGRLSPLPELPVQYADFAQWQRQWLREGELERQLAYWRRQLAGDLPVLRLPTDRPRPAVQTYRGAALFSGLSAPLSAELRELAQSRKVTLFMAMLAAFQTLLFRYTRQSDVLVGSPIANRNRVEIEALIGFFVNNLVLRTDLSGEPTFAEVLERVRQVTLEAYAHQDVPFEQLVDELRPERSLGHTPLFQALFALQNAPLPGWTMGNLTIVPLPVDSGTAKFDLELMSDEREESLPLALEYSTDLFDAATMDRLLAGFQVLLAGVVADPERRLSELPLLTDAERGQIAAWNDTARDLPLEEHAHRLFEAQAVSSPDRTAVSCGDHGLSYAELNRWASRLAWELIRRGVGPDSVVALLSERGIDFLVAVLAVFKAGGAYLPLDPAHPAPRLRDVLRLSGARLVLCGPGHAERLGDGEGGGAAGAEIVPLAELAMSGSPEGDPPPRATPGNLAYVIFTSGSTGTPKGAMLEHRGMLNHLFAKIGDLGLSAADTVAQNASQCFDISVWQLLAPLLVGGRVHVVNDEAAHDPRSLLAEVERGGVTVLETVPSLLRVLLDQALLLGETAALARLRWMIPTGEALPPRLCRDWLAAFPGVPLLNAYGPTECSDDVAHHPLRTPPETGVLHVPIGRPVSNLRLYVLDSALGLAPVGVAGELGVAGAGVGRGYLNDPARTAEVFIPDPWSAEPGARLYRTGDLVRHCAGGEIEFLGRIDDQVKIRGHRIELGEIEVALARHPAVAQAAVAVWRTEGAGGDRLAAYAVPRAGACLSPAELRAFLAERLPAALVPSACMLLDALPVTANGKLDRRALPAPELDGSADGAAAAEPRTALERRIAALWRELLGVSPIGPTSHFFELGGDSVRGAIFINRLQAKLGRRVPVRALFEAPTLAALAERVEGEAGDAESDLWAITPLPREGSRALPLSAAQQRLWFVEQAHPGLGHYNSPAALRLVGHLDLPALEAAATEIVRRHEVVRASFGEEDGVPVQRIAPAWRVRLPVVDLSALPEAAREEVAARLLAAEGERPFDLERGPLMRWLLVRLAPEEHAALLTLHHIVSDASTGVILVREIGELYRASVEQRPAALPPLPVQYADFAAWQQRWLEGGVLAEGLAYWGQVLQGPLPVLQLPVDRPRPERPTLRGTHLRRALPHELAAGLRELSRRAGVTLFTTLLAGFVALLFRRTRQDDILLGTAVEGRGRAEVEGIIGVFVNMLALRLDVSGDPTFATLLERARDVAAGAFAHQDVPFDRLVEHLRLGRDATQGPLFQVAFGLDNVPGQALELPGLTITPLALRRETVRFDLTLWMVEDGEGLSALWTYSTELFHEATVARLHEQYETLLRGALASPEARLGDLALQPETRRAPAADEDWSFVPGRRTRGHAIVTEDIG